MRRFKWIVVLTFALLLLLCLTACQKTYYDVFFDTDGGSVISQQSVEEGKFAVKPAENPTKNGFTFEGWYEDEEFSTLFDWESPVTATKTIYAKFTPDVVLRIVIFEGNGGGSTVSQTIADGTKVTQPSEPERQGYVFKGWYLDDGTFNNLFDFESSVTSDLTLYAKWARVFTVTFHNDDGNSINAQLIEEGQKATESADLSVNKSGDWRFGGWYIDEELQNTFDFDTEISSDVDLWAKWDQWFLIRFVDISGVNTKINDLEIKAGDTPENLPVLTRDGYDFKGWYNYYGTNKIDFNNVATSLKAFALWEKTVSNAVGHEGVFTLDSDAENWIDRAGYLGFKRWLDCEFKYVDSETVWCDPGMGYFLENISIQT